MQPCWSPGTSSVSRGLRQSQVLVNIVIEDQMMGESAPSASSQMLQNWDKWLIHQRFILLSRGTLTGCRNGLTGALWTSTRENVKVVEQQEIIPGTSTHWWPADWKAALQKRTSGSWWVVGQLWAVMAKKADNLLAPAKTFPEGQGRWPLPHCTALERPHLEYCVGSSVEERHGHAGETPWRGYEDG